MGTFSFEKRRNSILALALRVHYSSHGSIRYAYRRVIDGKETKLIADAVGIRIKDQWLPYSEGEVHDNPYKRIETVYCIEAKVSRNDFQSGYCIGGDLNYVITPRGLVKKDEVYKGVGLIEVDLDRLEFTKNWGLLGVEITKRATNRNQLSDDVTSRGKWIDRVFRDMARQLTINGIRNNPWFYPGFSTLSGLCYEKCSKTRA